MLTYSHGDSDVSGIPYQKVLIGVGKAYISIPDDRLEAECSSMCNGQLWMQ
jgi:hypothetical protein